MFKFLVSGAGWNLVQDLEIVADADRYRAGIERCQETVIVALAPAQAIAGYVKGQARHEHQVKQRQ